MTMLLLGTSSSYMKYKKYERRKNISNLGTNAVVTTGQVFGAELISILQNTKVRSDWQVELTPPPLRLGRHGNFRHDFY